MKDKKIPILANLGTNKEEAIKKELESNDAVLVLDDNSTSERGFKIHTKEPEQSLFDYYTLNDFVPSSNTFNKHKHNMTCAKNRKKRKSKKKSKRKNNRK